MPEPALVNAPLVPEMTPENVVEVLSPPAVNTPAPKVMLPAPAMDPTVSELPFRLNVAPGATVTEEVFGSKLPAPSCNVPALIFVVPV